MSKSNFVTIGRLKYFRDEVENGRFGKVFRGQYEELVDVSIFRVDKSEFTADKQILRATDMHPNIIRFYGSEEDEEFHYIAFEKSLGTLKELVCGKYRGPHFVDDNTSSFDYQSFGRQILKQITSAIVFLHSNQILHLDIKPSNVSISCASGAFRPRVKLAHFGFSRHSKNPLPLWKILGTKGWMAPEGYDQDYFTSQMDIFSLGLLFAYVLSRGLHAFGSSKEERIIRIKMKQPLTMAAKQLQCVGATEVFDLINSMLNFIPEERPNALKVFNHIFFKNSKLSMMENKSSSALISSIKLTGK
jgi:serine/threonine-protein kinase/endoribonuclease IRE1